MATALTIRNNDNLLEIVHSFLSDNDFFKGKTVKISDKLKNISIHFTGPTYNSSIPSSAMRAFLELQDSIYAIYSEYAYSEKKRLSAVIRHELELDVIVKEGSSLFEVRLNKITDAIAKRIKAMTGKELAGVTAAVCLTFLVSTLGSKAIDHKAEIEKLKELRATLTGVQKNTADAMIEAMESQQSFYRITSSQSFEALEINGQPFTQEELREMVKTQRVQHPIETKVYSGKYRITDIHLGDDTVYLDVIGITGGTVVKNVNLLKGIISANDYQWFKDSTAGLEVDMTIVATEKNGEIIASFLQSFSIPNN
jgi:hypothetical protein